MPDTPPKRLTAFNLVPAIEAIVERPRDTWKVTTGPRAGEALDMLAGIGIEQADMSIAEVAAVAEVSRHAVRTALARWQNDWSPLGREIAYTSCMDHMQREEP